MASLRQTIIDNLKETLEGMREGAGYNFDWKQVYTYPPAQIPQWPSVLVTDGVEEQGDIAYPKIERRFQVEIEGAHKVPTDEANEPDKAARRMIEDIERCVLSDHTRGSNAIDTRPVRAEAPVIFAGQVHVTCLFEILYHTNRTQPGANV